MGCAGIGRQTRIEEKTREEEYTVWEKRYRGLCRSSEFYIGIPAKRVVHYQQEVTTYQLQPEAIQVIPSVRFTLSQRPDS